MVLISKEGVRLIGQFFNPAVCTVWNPLLKPGEECAITRGRSRYPLLRGIISNNLWLLKIRLTNFNAPMVTFRLFASEIGVSNPASLR